MSTEKGKRILKWKIS